MDQKDVECRADLYKVLNCCGIKSFCPFRIVFCNIYCRISGAVNQYFRLNFLNAPLNTGPTQNVYFRLTNVMQFVRTVFRNVLNRSRELTRFTDDRNAH